MIATAALVGGCAFDPSGIAPGAPDGGAPPLDGARDVALEGAAVTGSARMRPGTVSTNADVIAVPGRMYLAAVMVSPDATVTTPSGLDASWQLVAEQCAAMEAARVSVFSGRAASVDGRVTAEVGDADSAAIVVVAYAGTDPAQPLGAIVSANSGEGAACTKGPETDTYRVTLDGAHGDGRVFVAVATGGEEHAPGDGLAEEAEVTVGRAGLAVADGRLTDATSRSISGRLSAPARWVAVAVEVVP